MWKINHQECCQQPRLLVKAGGAGGNTLSPISRSATQGAEYSKLGRHDTLLYTSLETTHVIARSKTTSGASSTQCGHTCTFRRNGIRLLTQQYQRNNDKQVAGRHNSAPKASQPPWEVHVCISAHRPLYWVGASIQHCYVSGGLLPAI